MEGWKLLLGKCSGELLSTIRSLTYWSKSSGEQLETGSHDVRGKTVKAARFAQPGANSALMGCYKEDGPSLSTYKLQLVGKKLMTIRIVKHWKQRGWETSITRDLQSSQGPEHPVLTTSLALL